MRLIDADALIKKYTTCAGIDCDTCPLNVDGCDGLIQILKDAPTVEDARGGDDECL